MVPLLRAESGVPLVGALPLGGCLLLSGAGLVGSGLAAMACSKKKV